MDVRVSWNSSVPDDVKQAAVDGVNQAAERLLAMSLELSPVDSGDNRRSASVHQATLGDLVAWVVYNMPYSDTIHEGVGMSFRTTRNPNAQAKFLEGPLRSERDLLIRMVQAQIRRAFR